MQNEQNTYISKTKLATTMSEVGMSEWMVIVEPDGSVKMQGKFWQIKAEWKDEALFYCRLRQLVDSKLIYTARIIYLGPKIDERTFNNKPTR